MGSAVSVPGAGSAVPEGCAHSVVPGAAADSVVARASRRRRNRRLRSLPGFLVDQCEDPVTTLPAGPEQLVLSRYVAVVKRVVVSRPPPTPGRGPGSGTVSFAPAADWSSAISSAPSAGARSACSASQVKRSFSAGASPVLEEVAAVRSHHRNVPAVAPDPLDQPTLLKAPGRVRTFEGDADGGGFCGDLAEHVSLLFGQRVLHKLRLHLDELRTDRQGRADERFPSPVGFHAPNLGALGPADGVIGHHGRLAVSRR